MLDLKFLRADKKASEEGTWAEYFGGKFLIARFNNDNATQLRAKLTIENYDALMKGGEEAVALNTEINARVMAETILLDWKDVGENGVELPFSKEVAFAYFSDPSLKDFYQFVENYSLNRTNYQTKTEEMVITSVKNTSA